MAPFLSAEWLADLDAAARRADVAGEPFTIEHRIADADAGELRYHVTIDGDGARVAAGAADAPTVTFVQDEATARAITSGRLGGRQAVIDGRIRVHGDVSALIDRRDDLARLDQAFRSAATGPG